VESLDGILCLNKPVGPSSAAALNRLKRSLPRGTKLGHAGTLDPLASGVLVCLLGRATKLSDRVMGMPKQYQATIMLGATSDTDDAEGPIRPTPNIRAAIDRDAVERVLSTFVGEISQMPPAFSALKIEGKRACDRVREGQKVELKPRMVRVDRIDLADFAWPEVKVLVDCGKGTYIRSLARDIGAALGVGGYMSALVRTRVGPFGLVRSVEPEQVSADTVRGKLVTLDELARIDLLNR
jgi:tRNA pseudouridine55 synthase